MLSASEHCQRGLSNPLDELPEREPPQEWIMGKYRTKEELLEMLNKDSRVVFEVDEHESGVLYISVPFEEEK